MNNIFVYGLIFAILLLIQLVYFRVARCYDILDKPNARSSHSSVVIRGGGVNFVVAFFLWLIVHMLMGDEQTLLTYFPFSMGLLAVSAISFADDIHSVSNGKRLIVQFVSIGLLLFTLFHANTTIDKGLPSFVWIPVVLLILVVSVGVLNIFNFMDGINGMTGAYVMSSLVPLYLLCKGWTPMAEAQGYFDARLIGIIILTDVIFCFFNLRPNGRAVCFSGDVGAIGVSFILLLLIGSLIFQTHDVTYMIFFLVYGVDGCLTIVHRIMLHENLGVSHRKHMYQLMTNELKIGHVKISLLYMFLQLFLSLGFIYLCPNTLLAHWCYLLSATVVLSFVYVLFMKKYYHRHQEYLNSRHFRNTV